MAAEAGIGGNVSIGGVTVANVGTWSVSNKADTADTTAFRATNSYRTKLTTIKDWSAKADGRTDPVDTNGQVALFNGLGSTFVWKFEVDNTHYWTGSGILAAIEPKSDATGLNEVSFSIEGSGALTFS